MKLKPIHHEAIQLLIDTRFEKKTQGALAKKIGVPLRTFAAWLVNDDFKAAYAAAVKRWQDDLEGIKFRHRRERVTELQRLYSATPDSYVEKIIHATGTVYDPETKEYIEVNANITDVGGEVLRDSKGNPVSVVAVRKMNVDAKASLLDQIAQEVGDKVAKHALTDGDGNDLGTQMKDAALAAISILTGGFVPGAAPGRAGGEAVPPDDGTGGGAPV